MLQARLYKTLIITSLLLMVLPAGLHFLIAALFQGGWENTPLHTILKTGSAFALFTLPTVWVMGINRNKLTKRYLWLCYGAVCLGVFNLLQACTANSGSQLWLHSLGSLFGALLLLGICLPPSMLSKTLSTRSPLIAAVPILAAGLGVLAFADHLPAATENARLSLLLGSINFLAATLFFISWLYFSYLFAKRRTRDKFILSCFSALLGSAALLYSDTVFWEASWWFNLLLQLGAYSLLLVYFVRLFHLDINRYQILYEQNPTMLFSVNQQQSVITLNAFCAQMLGYRKEELIRTPLKLTYVPEDWIKVKRQMQELFKSHGKISTWEAQRLCKNGNTFWVMETVRSSLDERGNATLFFVSEDISKRKKLEEMYRRYENIINTTSDAMALVDTNFRYLAINQRYLDAYGISREQVIGRHMREVISPENFEASAKFHVSKALAGEISKYQRWVTQPGFGKRYLELTDTPYFNEEGEISGAVVCAHDITQRKLAENALRKSEQRLKSYFEADVLGMTCGDPDGIITDCNKKFCDIIGYTMDEVIGMSVYDLTHKSSRDLTRKLIKPMLQGISDGYSIEKKYIRKDGNTVPVSVSVACIRHTDGSIDYCMAFIQDLTDRVEAENKLLSYEKRFYEAFESIPDAIAITRAGDGTFMYVNPGFTRSTGYSQEEVVGQQGQDLNIFSDKSRNLIHQKLEEDGRVINLELEATHKSGSRDYILFSATPIELGEEQCIISMSRDITDIKQAEQERRNLEQQLFRSQKMEAIGQLTGGIAHDFNNILASILGYTELALDRSHELADEELEDFLQEVRHGGERARDIIKQMMTYSRAVPTEKTPQQLPPLIESSLQFLRPLLPSNIHLHYSAGKNLPDVQIDSAQFEQVFINICINAKDAISGNGEIFIDIYKAYLIESECASCHDPFRGAYVVLSVKDTGVGIDPQSLSLIFNPFYTTKEAGKGTGMGLAMVHGILHNSNGHILVDSSPREGTRFRLLFPIARNAQTDAVEREQLEYEEEHIEEEPILLDKKVMIVDDEPAIANYLSSLLSSQGFRTKFFTDSQNALKSFQIDPQDVDLIILDQTMPGLTGLELSKEILKVRPELPIIITSGYSDVLDNTNFLQRGIRAYFKKPFDGKELLSSIRDIFT